MSGLPARRVFILRTRHGPGAAAPLGGGHVLVRVEEGDRRGLGGGPFSGLPLDLQLVAGIGTGSWWQQQLDRCLIGLMATCGWETALGDAGELSWWEEAAADAAARQHIAIPR